LTALSFLAGPHHAQLPHQAHPLKQQEQLYFRHLTRDSGLPSGNVRWITCDFLGYMWIATDNGVVRYDGTEMKLFQYIPGSDHSIVESAATVILESIDSMLWIGTKNGISVYNPFRDSFSNFQFNPGEPNSFPGDWVLSIYDDHAGNIWIGTDKGLIRTDPHATSFQLYRLHTSDDHIARENLVRWVNRISNDPRDHSRLLLATRGGLLLFDKETGTIIKDYDQGTDHLYRCEAMFIDEDFILWTGEWDTGLKKFDLTTVEWEVFNPPGEPNLNILGITEKNREELWLGTVNMGVGIFNKADRTFQFFSNRPEAPKSVISDWVQGDFYKDEEGVIWVPTPNGISISDPFYRSFTYYVLPSGITKVYDFYRDFDNNRLYVAGAGAPGLQVWDEAKGKWLVFPPESGKPRKIIIHRLLKDSIGILWLATSHGLYYIEKNGSVMKEYRDEEGLKLTMKDQFLHGLMEDNSGNLWVGSRFEGIFRIHSDRLNFTRYEYDPSDPGSLTLSKDYMAIHEDRQGRIWFGHYNGITVFDPVQERFMENINDSLIHNGIRRGVIWGIAEDTLGRIYLSIEKEGLLRVEENEPDVFTFKLFHLNHGLSDLNLFDIARDPYGDLWIINEGVTRFNPYSETFQVFDARNGLHDNKSWGDKIYIDREGNLFLTAIEGYEVNNIYDLNITPGITHLHLEPLEINGMITTEGVRAAYSGEITLAAGQNNLTFHYKAICFRDADQVKYAYMLEGFDHDWTLAGNDNEARYTNLRHGEYTFVVRAFHRGEMFPGEKTLVLTIHPYFWQTAWFIAIASLFVVVILITVYLLRIRQIRKKERMMAEFQKKLAESEMQALRAQMNPHFIFNSLNSINNFILKNETEAASDFLTKFSRLVRQVLNNSKNKLVSLEDELTALQLYLELEQLRFNNKFDFEIIKDRKIDAESAMVPPLLIQPYVENAIWHGLMHKDGAGSIVIAVELSDGHLKFTIEDNGIGRKKAMEYKSKFGVKKQSVGMKITRDRIEMLNEMYRINTELRVIDLENPDGSAAGTRIEMNIPLINRNLISP